MSSAIANLLSRRHATFHAVLSTGSGSASHLGVVSYTGDRLVVPSGSHALSFAFSTVWLVAISNVFGPSQHVLLHGVFFLGSASNFSGSTAGPRLGQIEEHSSVPYDVANTQSRIEVDYLPF